MLACRVSGLDLLWLALGVEGSGVRGSDFEGLGFRESCLGLRDINPKP